MGKDDGSWGGIFNNVTRDVLGIAYFPIERIDRPDDDAETVFLVKSFGKGGVDGSVGRAHDHRADACGFFDGVIGLGDFSSEGGRAKFGKLGVAPAVVGNLVAFVNDAFGDVGKLGDIFSNDEKCGFDAPFFKEVEKFGCELGVRAVVECHGHSATLDIATVVGGLPRSGWCRGGGWRGNRSFGGVHGLNNRLRFDHNRCLRSGVRWELGFGRCVGNETNNEPKEKKG